MSTDGTYVMPAGSWLSMLFALCYVAMSTAGVGGEALSNGDFVVAICATIERLNLVHATAAWRRNIRLLVVINDPAMVTSLNEARKDHHEVYDYWPDDSSNRHGKYQGDSRCGITPFLAHQHFKDSYKWMLYADDDTIFFMVNVVRLLDGYDPGLPYAISDNIWYTNGHPSTLAPRCLPCHAPPPSGNLAGLPIKPVRGCPCKARQACGSHNPRKDKLFLRIEPHPNCQARGISPKDCPDFCKSQKPFYSLHGGAGAILSTGLFDQLYPTFGAAARCVNNTFARGGDSLFNRCIVEAGLYLTDPGPMLLSGQTRNILFDNPARHVLTHPLDLLLYGECDAHCVWLLHNGVSLHLSARSYPSPDHAELAIATIVRNHALAHSLATKLVEAQEKRGWPQNGEPGTTAISHHEHRSRRRTRGLYATPGGTLDGALDGGAAGTSQDGVAGARKPFAGIQSGDSGPSAGLSCIMEALLAHRGSDGSSGAAARRGSGFVAEEGQAGESRGLATMGSAFVAQPDQARESRGLATMGSAFVAQPDQTRESRGLATMGSAFVAQPDQARESRDLTTMGRTPVAQGGQAGESRGVAVRDSASVAKADQARESRGSHSGENTDVAGSESVGDGSAPQRTGYSAADGSAGRRSNNSASHSGSTACTGSTARSVSTAHSGSTAHITSQSRAVYNDIDSVDERRGHPALWRSSKDLIELAAGCGLLADVEEADEWALWNWALIHGEPAEGHTARA